jgi:hypothetical protein
LIWNLKLQRGTVLVKYECKGEEGRRRRRLRQVVVSLALDNALIKKPSFEASI